jgi:serine/threonine-protein kinase
VSELIDRLTAALADSYEIQQELGAGGMATVYLARDQKHDRLVAVKVLLPDLAASLGHERFLREIQVTAKLSHPHILPLYDSGQAEGFLFYVMPFVEGETLGDLIAREKQLPIPDAVRITREVAEALGHAHAYGLVHRDIKPANVMLSGGHAVVADFGIALAVTEAGGEKLTQTGTAIGTAIYMSPEQAMGLEDIDGRSDVYSLGCMLYEMLVGQVPFTGPNPQAIMARHTMDAVSPPSIIRQTITPELEDIIFTALAKAPADRFRTAGEFAEALSMLDSGTLAQQRHSRAVTAARTAHTEALERTGGRRRIPRKAVAAVSAVAAVGIGFGIWQLWPGGGSGSPVSAGGLDPSDVAVLYFDDLSSNGTLGHVADGLTEGLIDQLSAVRELDVISRGGVSQFRDSDVPRDSIGRALAVGSIVIGSVEPEGDDLRVTTRLVDGESGAEFSRASFSLPADELLLVMDSVTKDVSRILRERLGDEVRTREIRAGTENAAAWTLMQRGERAMKDAAALEDEDAEAALAAYARADSLLALAEAADPEWIEPIVSRGWVLRWRAALADEPREQDALVEEGMGHAERALALESQNPKALELRGTLRYQSWYYGPEPEQAETDRLLGGAREDLEAAVAADPGLANAYATLSLVHYNTDKRVDASLAALRAYEADAYVRNTERLLWRLYGMAYDLENFSEALRWCEEGQRRFPENDMFVECQLWLFTTRAVEPDPDRAWALQDSFVALLPEHDREYFGREGQMLVAAALGKAGLVDSARNLLTASRGNLDIDPDRSLVTLEAFIRTLIGDNDEALELLRSYYIFNPHHREEASEDVHWWWRSLADDPRYQELIRPPQ